MIFVLKNADFSANNIGTIPLDIEVHEETELIAARFAGMTDNTKSHLNIFVDRLIKAGIYSKLKHLMLPLVAGNVADALQNVLTAEKEVIADTGYAAISSKGITFTDTGFLSLNPAIQSSQANFSYRCAVVNVATPTASTSERIVTLSSESSATLQFLRGYVDVSGSGTTTLHMKAANEKGADSLFVDGAVIHSINNGVLSYLSSASETGSYTLANPASVTALKLSGANNTDFHQYLHSYAIRLLFIADNLSSAQIVAMYNAMQEFIAAEV